MQLNENTIRTTHQLVKSISVVADKSLRLINTNPTLNGPLCYCLVRILIYGEFTQQLSETRFGIVFYKLDVMTSWICTGRYLIQRPNTVLRKSLKVSIVLILFFSNFKSLLFLHD